jgi:hypothetical protein
MRTIFLIVIGSILLNFALAEFGRGAFGHGIIVIGLIAYIAVPATLLGLVGVALGQPLSNARTMSRIAFAVALVATSTLVSLPIGTAKLEQDIQAAEGYCESLIPRLEAHKRQHGMYPSDLGSVGELAEPPRLLKDWPYYGTNGSEFWFSFDNPAGMMNGYMYDSRTKRWDKWD